MLKLIKKEEQQKEEEENRDNTKKAAEKFNHYVVQVYRNGTVPISQTNFAVKYYQDHLAKKVGTDPVIKDGLFIPANLSITLDGISGIDAVKMLPKYKVLLMSAGKIESSSIKGLKNIVGFVSKPIDPVDLINMVKSKL